MAKTREVKISSRTIYSKYCEIYIEIPKDFYVQTAKELIKLYDSEVKVIAIDESSFHHNITAAFGWGK